MDTVQGTMMEKYLTMSMNAFRRDLVSASPGGPFVQSRVKDVYRYAKVCDLLSILCAANTESDR